MEHGALPTVRLCEVVVPGPWWHGLTYSLDAPAVAGARAVVPLGAGERIGILGRIFDADPPGGSAYVIKPVKTVVDSLPLLPTRLLELLEWGGKVFLCGTGEILRTAVPSSLLAADADAVALTPLRADPGGEYREDCIYTCNHIDRWSRYRERLEESRGFIALFPEQSLAAEFWSFLPDEIGRETVLWPPLGGKRLLAAWLAARNGGVRGVVGGPGAVFAPLQRVDTIIVDEESSGAYRAYKRPFVNSRTLAGRRARLESASLVLAGRVPSSRVFLRGSPRSKERPSGSRLRFVDIREGFSASSLGVEGATPLTKALLSGTEECLASGRTALWLLDRKGYAGEVACEECGNAVRCGVCGSAMAWEDRNARLRCPACGAVKSLPDQCPVCRGLLLVGKRPGLEALLPVAASMAGEGRHSFLVDDARATGKRALGAMREQLAQGGIVVGTRRALSLCDQVRAGFIAWIDVDAELRSVAYQARFTVFSMVWESLWRGKDGEDRVVLLQSRRPGSGWQRALKLGWGAFWRQELNERKELGLPPFAYLLEVRAATMAQKASMIPGFQERGLFPMDPGADSPAFWVASGSLTPAREVLAPYFSIKCSGRGFPEVSVWID